METLHSIIAIRVDYPEERDMLVVAHDLPLECIICLDLRTKLFVFADCERDAQSRDGKMYHATYIDALAALMKDAEENDEAIAALEADRGF